MWKESHTKFGRSRAQGLIAAEMELRPCNRLVQALYFPVFLLRINTYPGKVILQGSRAICMAVIPLHTWLNQACIMSLITATDRSSRIRALNARISELENLYADLFLQCDSRELLKSIHLELEALKRELKHMVR